MSSSLEDLHESIFFLTYNAGIQPSEIDKLTTHEMRKFVDLTLDTKKKEAENGTSIFSSISKSLGGFRRG